MRFVEANGIRYAYLNELTGQAVEKLHVSMHVEASGIELSVVSASSTSRWEFIQAVAAALAAPVAMFAQSNAPVARAWVRTELVQLEKSFAGAWSACYTTVFGIVASIKKVTLPPDYSVDIKVNIGQTGSAWFLGAEFTVRVPGLARDLVEELAHPTHLICPYSKSVRGNIEVSTSIVTV
jgi:hypothetical protein